MRKEISALEENETWDLIRPPSDSDIVDCRWVYKIKTSATGEIKYKARLVARGFSQIYGENYWETYAPVVKSSTIRLLIASAVESGMKIGQLDVRNAYVKSELKECVYMRQPPGFEKGRGLVCKLKKSLYGLKQAGHEWSQCLNDFLEEELKFTRLESDPCVYIKEDGNNTIIITVYVDDLLIFCRKTRIIDEFKTQFNNKFEIEDLGECKKIIGIELDHREDGSIAIHQRQFISDLLEKYNMQHCKTTRTPLQQSQELVCDRENHDECELVNEKEYRALIGKLLYISGSTRPDIAFSISSLSRFNNKPHKIHQKAAINILRYLKGTINYEIVYKRTGESLYGHSDADYSNCKIDRRSYTGFVIILAGAPVSWESRKQPTVALSSTEAEYMAITSAAKEIMFLYQVMGELNLGMYCKAPINLFSDNMSAIKLASKIGFSTRTKHIDVRHHYIRKLVKNKKIELIHVGTEDMMADICTKSLGPIKHRINASRLLI